MTDDELRCYKTIRSSPNFVATICIGGSTSTQRICYN